MFELFDPQSEIRITNGTSLPHWFQPGATYFVTWRTADSVPPSVAAQWQADRRTWLSNHGVSLADSNWKTKFDQLPRSQRRDYHRQFSQHFLQYLDQGHGACELKRPPISKIVADSLLCFDDQKYDMGDFVVMPNHVHLLVGLIGDTDIRQQCRSWKRFTAAAINRKLGRQGPFWQEGSFDHLVRSPEQFAAIQRYIADNPRRLRRTEYVLYQRQAN